MRVAIAADELTGVAASVAAAVRARGHEVAAAHGAFATDERDDWAWASEAAARDVAEGRAGQAGGGWWRGAVCGWGGGRASPPPTNRGGGGRAPGGAAATPAGAARRWNDANVLALS